MSKAIDRLSLLALKISSCSLPVKGVAGEYGSKVRTGTSEQLCRGLEMGEGSQAGHGPQGGCEFTIFNISYLAQLFGFQILFKNSTVCFQYLFSFIFQ